jgi:putative FmdB family regulatory protein
VPFYEYRCVKGHTFEVRQSMSDEALTTCEVCGAEAARVLFAPAIHFKGSGFHNTDYGSRRRGSGDDGAATPSTADAGANGASGGSDGAGSTAKPAESSGGSKTVGLDKI